ncbi:MAG: hypothetical protein HRU06_18540 [Oceanospirillaceae bacterium]|nr:hypothetical protein [Oceanospirillaceae bacterium]
MLNVLDSDSSKIADLLVSQIRHDILFGILATDLILDTKFLSIQYGGSTSYLIEALERLEDEGFLKLTPQLLYQVMRPINNDTSYVLESRVEIECEGIEKSINNGNIHWHGMVIQAHKSWIDSCTSATLDPRQFALDFEENIRLLHRKIISACGCTRIINQQEKLFQQGRLLRISVIENPDTNLKAYALLASDLVSFILDKDIKAAKIALERLIYYI